MEFRKTSVAEILNFNYKISVSNQIKLYYIKVSDFFLNRIGSKFGVMRTVAAI